VILSKYPKASQEEINRLKGLIKQVDTAQKVNTDPQVLAATQTVKITPQPRSVTLSPKPSGPVARDSEFPFQDTTTPVKRLEIDHGNLFKGGIANVPITRDAINIDNPVELLLILKPDFTPYKWQFETLMQAAGYLTPGKYRREDKTLIGQENPFKLLMPAANGSGKDMVLIAAFAVWFALVKARNRVIITSSSFDQTKFQTEPHIRDLVTRANKKFGQLFKSTQFHHVAPELGTEIKLFATDESGKAEGFHPFGDGDMAVIINEAKSVHQSIYDALLRCTGYSHWLEISSPGPRAGFMFKHVEGSVEYPNPVVLTKYYRRHITAFDCPHITKAHIDFVKFEMGEDSPWYKSSVLAEFSDFDITSVITEADWNQCIAKKVKSVKGDIGIGLDLAAGGDENACFVRDGNQVVHSFFFQQRDTDTACFLMDKQLEPWKKSSYTFRADNGGIGHSMIDKLESLGWNISRTNNQSPANNKREFLNLGAEMWFHVRRLIQRGDIILPEKVNKLREQLTTRLYRGLDTTQGKFALESKAEAKASGRHSPDRGDAFVLCFSSYHPARNIVEEKTDPRDEKISVTELLKRAANGSLWNFGNNNRKPGRFTQLSGKI